MGLELEPFPEGPRGPTFTRETTVGGRDPLMLDIGDVYSFIPDPLPRPAAWQGFSCRLGGNLVVTLLEGETIRYGPCRRPASIDALWARMIDVSTKGACKPDCGPGAG